MAVEQRLHRQGLPVDRGVGGRVADIPGRRLGAGVAAESPLAHHEQLGAGGEQQLTGGGVHRLARGVDHRAGALVVDAHHRSCADHRPGGADFPMNGQLLLAVYQLVNLVVAVSEHGITFAAAGLVRPTPGAHEAGVHLLGVPGGLLPHEGQIIKPRSHAERIQGAVPGQPTPLMRLAPLSHQVQVHRHAAIVTQTGPILPKARATVTVRAWPTIEYSSR